MNNFFCKNSNNNSVLPFILMVVVVVFSGCEKTLKLNYKDIEIRQVVNCNFSPDAYLKVNISKSKRPDDISPIYFLQDCKVDVFEDGIFKETMPFILKDTLLGLGYYTSTFKLSANKTYKIISSHDDLATIEATEYLPPRAEIVNFALLQHADSLHPSLQGQYIIAFQDSIVQQNYYYLSTYYKVLKPTVNDVGDTIYKIENIYVPSYTADIPNFNNNTRLYTSDTKFDGQLKTLSVSFPSGYIYTYKEIKLVVELSNLGKNYYQWNTLNIKLGTDYLNQGQMERNNSSNNIKNGFGHFSAFSSSIITVRIK